MRSRLCCCNNFSWEERVVAMALAKRLNFSALMDTSKKSEKGLVSILSF